MPLFLPDDELARLAGDTAAVAAAADAYIRPLLHQISTLHSSSDAAAIAAEQSAALLDQRFQTLTADLVRLTAENATLNTAAEQRGSDLADALAEKHGISLKLIGKDGEVERLAVEIAEVRKGKRQLMEVVKQKDTEIMEKNATIQSYYDKIITLTEKTTSSDTSLHELEAELARCQAACNRGIQEKELLEKHNSWLNEELTTKANCLAELRRKLIDQEADVSVKLDELDRQLKQSSSALNRSKERTGELELRVASLEEDLRTSMATAASNEERFAGELSTVTKLVDLYKESSAEWSKKAGELEGVIKALETHLAQVENDYKEKLDTSVSARQDLEKEVTNLKEKLYKHETEIETARKANELCLVPISGFHADSNLPALSSGEAGSGDRLQNIDMLVPKAPLGISATALATSLLRDGWSLAKMYEKYQDAADALRHEKWGRKHAEAMLERVLHEIEQKAELILDERAEHERVVEAYTLLNQKLQLALAEHDNFQNRNQHLMAELKQMERDQRIAEKEIDDLQKQVTILLKECQDVQLRCGDSSTGNSNVAAILEAGGDCFDPEYVVSKHLTFKDINGLVEQNVKLRSLVHKLSFEEEKRDVELKETLKTEVQKVNDRAAAQVEAVLKRCEEQGCMIESLHCSVALYKRLYEQERKGHASTHSNGVPLPGDGKELMRLFDNSQEVSKKSHDELVQRTRNLEHDLNTLRSELSSLRLDRDKFLTEANFSRERLDSFKKEYENMREDANAVSARNIELSHLVVDYQKKLRENSDAYESSLESTRKLSMELSIMRHEKDILVQTEKRASDEVRSLLERVHRLQSTLDTIQSAEEVRENARTTERKRNEEYLQRAEREWAEAKKELQEERDRVRALTVDREKAIENSSRQVEEMRKELADAWQVVASAESRAAVAEARISDLQGNINTVTKSIMRKDADVDHSQVSTSEDAENLWKLKEELEKVREESRANKDYMLQYKNIAHMNEVALKQIESAHEEYKTEAEKMKKSHEEEILSLRNILSEMESNNMLKSQDAASAIEAKERVLSSAFVEASSLRDEIAAKVSQLSAMEMQVSSLKDDLENEHKRWRTTRDNYERQVIMQSETIQELTNTSREVSSLQCELAKQRKLSEELKTENDLLKASSEQEKLQLQELKVEAERKYNEIDEQNKILHGRLESLHIRLADREQFSAGISFHTLESDLQTVVSYLRRSKEIAETEISLLKQEKSRLQSQLENALQTSEATQALLRSQRQNSKAILFKDEEFKSLQLQVREICLLRESNIQLREENKHNFDECQKFREEARAAKCESENINRLLNEKQIEYEASKEEIQTLKMEIELLNKRMVELLQNSKNIDTEDYERMKNGLEQNKVLLSEKEEEIQQTQTHISSYQHQILELEQALTKSQLEVTEQKNKLNAAPSDDVKAHNERLKKWNSGLKRRNESLAKEKEDLSKQKEDLSKQKEELLKENVELSKEKGELAKEKEEHAKEKEELLKQIEDIKTRTSNNKEKDARMHILEKTLEKERGLKLKAQKDLEVVQKDLEALTSLNNTDKKDVQSSMLAVSELPSSVLFDRQASQSLVSMEDCNLPLNDSSPAVTPNTGTAAIAGRQAPVQQIKPTNALVADTTDRPPNAAKPNSEIRKVGRRIVRPRLEHHGDPAVEIEASTMEGPTTDGKAGASQEPEQGGDISMSQPISIRKRRAPSPVSEVKEDSVTQDDASDIVVPVSKKSRDTELAHAVSGQSIPSASDIPDIVHFSDNVDEQPAIEDMEFKHALASTNEEDSDAPDEDNCKIKEEMDDQQKGGKDGTNYPDFQVEADPMLEDIAVEPIEEPLKGDDGADILQSSAEGDDEREEGELEQDEPEQKLDGASGDGEQEPTAGDEIGVTGETEDVVEALSPDVLSENNENADIEDSSVESSKQGRLVSKDQVATDVGSAFQASPSTREESPSTSANFTEKNVSRSGRILNLRPRAPELRQVSEANPPLSNRGRGRSSLHRSINRGRGGRGARGSGFNDKERS